MAAPSQPHRRRGPRHRVSALLYALIHRSECVEGFSLMKTPPYPPPRSLRGLNARLWQRLGIVQLLFWSIDRSDNDFFNRLGLFSEVRMQDVE
jgi:hypothetical protein